MIHGTSIISEKARIADNVAIGPYCVVGDGVEIANNVKLHAHVCIGGNTLVGAHTQIFPFACIGYPPQDLKYKGEESYVIIGSSNVVREYVTIHPGTKLGNMKTVIGNNCLLMIGAHVAHDCTLGNNIVLANHATLGGHVVVDDFAILGGLSAVHQFVRIGKHAIIGGVSAVVEDVIPYGSAVGDRATLAGLNIRGMKRRNFSKTEIHAIRHVYEMIFLDDSDTFAKRMEIALKEYGDVPSVAEMIAFLHNDTNRPICLPRRKKHKRTTPGGKDSV
ncbi:acyl-(acyl-carrier-protein)--UDP-N-acetylglucosamine O-acyltransferase [Alphaproteobacteria bacterium]